MHWKLNFNFPNVIVRTLDITRVHGVVDTGHWESTVRGKQSQAGGEQRVRGVKRQIVTVE